MKRVGLLVTLLFLVGIVGTAQAAIETIKVSGDINLNAVNRGNMNLGGGMSFNGTSWVPMVGNDNSDSFMMSQIRLRFDADLTENVFATVGLIYEGDWGKDYEYEQYTDAAARRTGKRSDISLDLAYITMKDFLQDGITVVVGRQQLRYGNALIVGDPDTNQVDDFTDKSVYQNKGYTGAPDLSLRKSFDAVKVSVDMAPFKYDVFYATLAEGAYNKNDDIKLYGIYGSYDVGKNNFVIEPYLIVKEGAVPSVLGYDAGLVYRQQKVYCGGVRVGGQPIENMMLSVESAIQTGTTSGNIGTTASGDLNSGVKNNFSAWAVQLIAQYMWKKEHSPALNVAYSYFSHDWDPMAEDQTASELVNIISPQTNCHQISANFSIMPREDITLSAGYTHYWVDRELAGFYSKGTGVYYTMNDNKSDFGGEFSGKMVYDYTEDVQISLAGGVFSPGDAFSKTNRETAYTARGGVKVIF